MSSHLFAMLCPRCGAVLEMLVVGTDRCPRCHEEYLERFGHVIPIEHGQVGSVEAQA